MPRRSTAPRLAAAAAFVAAAALGSAGPAEAQTAAAVAAELKPYAKTQDLQSTTAGRVRQLYEAKARVTGPDEKINKEAMTELARHYVYKITQERYYSTGPESGPLDPRAPVNTVAAVLRDLDGFIVRPTADNVGRLTVDHAEYIKFFGEALDATVEPLLKAQSPLVRLNAARILAAGARSGAPAHAKTIQKLLTDPTTPPEVLLYAYKGAEGLLGAWDPAKNGRTNASGHTLIDEQLVPFVTALEKHVLQPPPVADKVALPPPPVAPKAPDDPNTPDVPPAAPAGAAAELQNKTLVPEQLAVIQYYRRAAVRALAKLRTDQIGGRNDIPEIRPGLTLAKIAVDDASISPRVTPTEQAEAVIGLLGMNAHPLANFDELCQAVATGVSAFVRPKAADAADRNIPWRHYAARMSAALADFRAMPNKNARASRSKNQVTGLAQIVQTQVLDRLSTPAGVPGGGPDLPRLDQWRQDNPSKSAGQFYEDRPNSKLQPRPAQ